jgi:hypothetical protein
MNSPLVIGIGAALGLLGAAGIYFDKRVPGRHLIVIAGLLRGTLVALITGLSMSAHSGWLGGLGWGALYGALFGAMISLSKGAAALQHAAYIIPTSVVTGAFSGMLIAWFAF